MAYELHIEREAPLTLDEWKTAVDATDGIRLDSTSSHAVNPKTAETIVVGGMDGDASILLDGSWVKCFRWSQSGRVSFAAPRDIEDPNSAILRMAKSLAGSLAAFVVGDEGEEY